MLLEQALQELPKYTDAYGCIVQADGDGGDSTQRFSAVKAMLGVLKQQQPQEFVWRQYEPNNDGWYRRHPVQWNAFSDYSRDQECMVVFCCALLGHKKRARRIAMKLLKRAGLGQNWDLPTPGLLAGLIRAAKLWPLRPALYALDVLLYAELYFRKKQLWDYDNMLFMSALSSKRVWSTPASRHFWKLYMRTDWRERVRHYHETKNGINGCDPVWMLYWAAAESEQA